MKKTVFSILLLFLFTLVMSCKNEPEKTAATDGTAFVVYEGELPCYDCAGIRISLAIDENSQLANRAYRLTETYLENPNADSIYSRFGSYQVLKGNSLDSTAIVYEIDADLKHARYFIRISKDTLFVANQNGDPILSPKPYYLIRTP